jgi:hypothetical protein
MLGALKLLNIHPLSFDVGAALEMLVVIYFVTTMVNNCKWWSPQCVNKVMCLSHDNAHEYGYWLRCWRCM